MYPNEDDDLQIKKLSKLYSNNSNSLLKISQVKVYSDGILINTTAAMLKPYLITLGEIPSKNGLNYLFMQSATEVCMNHLMRLNKAMAKADIA